MRVYDLLGKEVAALVNQKQAPGNYSVSFNRLHGQESNLSSGAYFYKLESDFSVQTKKMLLIK